jgi:hypothetical protein
MIVDLQDSSTKYPKSNVCENGRAHDTVGVAANVYVVLVAGLITKRIGYLAQVAFQFKPGVFAAVISQRADNFGRDAARGSISVAGDKVAVVLASLKRCWFVVAAD